MHSEMELKGVEAGIMIDSQSPGADFEHETEEEPRNIESDNNWSDNEGFWSANDNDWSGGDDEWYGAAH